MPQAYLYNLSVAGVTLYDGVIQGYSRLRWGYKAMQGQGFVILNFVKDYKAQPKLLALLFRQL